MNNLYFFILGQNSTLSSVEIDKQIKGKIVDLTNNFLILEPNQKIDVHFWQEKLGGTIKIGEVISQINASDIADDTNFHIIEDRLSKIGEHLKKIYFGFSIYGSTLPNNNISRQIKKWAMVIKNYLKEKGFSSRWVVSKEKSLSSVIVMKNKLLDKGAEFVFLLGKHSSYFGQTLSCQDFEGYSKRDFGRPSRLMEHGMIPPKLAKIMINFSQTPINKNIFDPFCGSGTILQEAALMGYQELIGSDLQKEAIESTKKNLAWLKTKAKINLFQADSRNISQYIKLASIDAIVTEPYLGPVKTKNIEHGIKNIADELSKLYLETFKEFKKILKPDGKIVIIFPVLKIKGQLKFLPIVEEIKKMGWTVVAPFTQVLKNNQTLHITTRNSIIYSRPNQGVLREIFVFKLW